MADRLSEMDVRTLSEKLALLDSNALEGTLTEGLAEVEKNRLGNIFSNVQVDAVVEILSG